MQRRLADQATGALIAVQMMLVGHFRQIQVLPFRASFRGPVPKSRFASDETWHA